MTHPSDSGHPRERARPTHPIRRNDYDHDHDRAVDSEDDCAHASGSTRAGPLVAEWEFTRTDDATLVTVHVTNTHAAPRTVRLENRLDGPALPPRRRGVVEAGWDEDGMTRRVPGEERVSVGYACHAPPKTPPVEIHDGPDDATTDETPMARALRSLGDHAPPRCVVSPDVSTGSDPALAPGSPRESASTPPAEPAPEDDQSTESVGEDDDHATEPADDDGGHAVAETTFDTGGEECGLVPPTAGPSSEAVPVTVAAWFRAVEARLAAADRLAGDVEEATPVIASLGGRAGVEVLGTTLEADAAALARVAARASELAGRVDGADVPDLEGPR
ncbi:hypothetical protein C2R22_18365 [Salinigranum rubrum]|uniref:DUF8080 domain-containing protein n=1 Tax=Salinigranum rubrum TaxID=755307 RepID=A0A2I8VN97_9EURY|nr:hypothetical protein [Salinigranum rubrum]AUV83365.1 hypothetical protein C2R22_18365 [Salinigranum rubrum]